MPLKLTRWTGESVRIGDDLLTVVAVPGRGLVALEVTGPRPWSGIRKIGSRVCWNGITVEIISVSRLGRIALLIDAPPEIRILRGELTPREENGRE